MSNEDKYAICVRCGKDYEDREKLRNEHKQIWCDDGSGKILKRHTYDF